MLSNLRDLAMLHPSHHIPGQKLHEEAGKKTGTHGWVPWVIVDGKSIGQKFDDFVSIVCKAYEGSCQEGEVEVPARALPRAAVQLVGRYHGDLEHGVCTVHAGPKPEACAEQPVTTRGFIRSCNQTHDRTW